jgi:hypothetical protein
MPYRICEKCKKVFTKKIDFTRHMSRKTSCVKDPVIEIIKLQLKIEKLKKQQNVNVTNIQNNNNSNNIKIIINGFFKNNNLDHITDSFYERCIDRILMGPVDLFEKIHFDPNVPENHNIFLADNVRNIIKVFDGVSWIEIDKDEINEFFLQVVIEMENMLNNYMYGAQDKNDIKLYDHCTKKYATYEKVREKEDSSEKLIKHLTCVIKNKAFMVRDTIRRNKAIKETKVICL